MGLLHFFMLFGIFFAAILLRYFLISGLFNFIFFLLFKRRLQNRILNHQTQVRRQMKREILWSGITSLIFAFFGALMVKLWYLGVVPVYIEVDHYPFWYIPSSLILSFFIHETYYYWLHRWMHRPKVYRLIHKVHHDSIATTSWTSFSFHPIEALAQALIIPVIVFLVPMHLYALMIFLFVMTLSGTLNHAGVELYPKNFKNHWFWKWVIGATHHDQHHKKFKYNFGLYFTFWDKWMGTESEDFQNKN